MSDSISPDTPQRRISLPSVLFTLCMPITAPYLAIPFLIMLITLIGASGEFRNINAYLFLSQLSAIFSYVPLALMNAVFWKFAKPRMPFDRFVFIAALLNGITHTIIVGLILFYVSGETWH